MTLFFTKMPQPAPLIITNNKMKDLKKNYARILILLLGCAIIFTACKKHNTAPKNPNPATVAKIIRFGDAINNNQFEYNAASNVAKITVVTDSVPTEYNITYQNGVPSQLQSARFLFKLIYTDGHLVRSEEYDNNTPELQSMTIFNYSANTLSEQLFYEKPVPSAGLAPQLKYKFETLPNGDISMVEIFLWDRTTGQYNFLGSDRYDYDGHPNPVYPTNDFHILYTIPATPHNVHKITSYDTSGILISVTTYDYIYNSTGYPVEAKRTNTPTGGFSSLTTLTYTYR